MLGRRVQFHHQRFIAEGRFVAVEGVNSGVFNAVEIEPPVAAFYEIKDDKIVQVTVYYDRPALSKVASKPPGA